MLKEITPAQKEAFTKHFASYAYMQLSENGSVYIEDTPGYAGDSRTWEILPNGDVLLESGNEDEGYETELIYPSAKSV